MIGSIPDLCHVRIDPGILIRESEFWFCFKYFKQLFTVLGWNRGMHEVERLISCLLSLCRSFIKLIKLEKSTYTYCISIQILALINAADPDPNRL